MYTAIHASCSSRSRTVQGESTNSRPGGACLMTSLTKNAPASPLQCALTKSQDLNPPGINTYKKPGASPLFFSLLPASLLPWLMAGTKLPPVAPAAACLDECPPIALLSTAAATAPDRNGPKTVAAELLGSG